MDCLSPPPHVTMTTFPMRAVSVSASGSATGDVCLFGCCNGVTVVGAVAVSAAVNPVHTHFASIDVSSFHLLRSLCTRPRLRTRGRYLFGHVESRLTWG